MKSWSEKTNLEKTADIISTIAFCFWLALEFINKNGDVSWADIAGRIAIIVICVFEGISYWNEHRVISYIAIGGLLLMLAIFVLEFIPVTN